MATFFFSCEEEKEEFPESLFYGEWVDENSTSYFCSDKTGYTIWNNGNTASYEWNVINNKFNYIFPSGNINTYTILEANSSFNSMEYDEDGSIWNSHKQSDNGCDPPTTGSNIDFSALATDIFNTSNTLGYNSSSINDYKNSNSINTGKIFVIDNYMGSHTFNLYHPEEPYSIFYSWILNENDQVYLNINPGEDLIIESHWGIQVVFGNGVASDINFVGEVSTLISE